jgi:hypothetical protein
MTLLAPGEKPDPSSKTTADYKSLIEPELDHGAAARLSRV